MPLDCAPPPNAPSAMPPLTPPNSASPILSRRGTAARWIVGLLWALVVGRITLTPAGPPGGVDDLVIQLCVLCGSRGTGDAILNMVLFIPLGLVLAVHWPAFVALAAGLLLSTGIEIAQLSIDGRYSNIGDILWNGSGAGLGAVAVRNLRVWLTLGPDHWRARLLAGGLPVLYLALAAVLVQPTGTDATYFGQWTPDLAYMPQYEGELLEASLNGHVLPRGPYPDTLDPRTWLHGDWTVRALVIKGPERQAVSPILSIYDGDRQEILLVGAHNSDLVLRERTIGDVLRMDRPDLRWHGVFANVDPGGAMVIEATRRGRDRCLRLDASLRCGIGFTPGDTWGLLMFLEGASRKERSILSFLWMGTLFFLVGLVGGSSRGVLVTTGAMVAMLLSVVAMSRLMPPSALEWLGITTGILAGVLVRPVVRCLIALPEPDNQEGRRSP